MIATVEISHKLAFVDYNDKLKAVHADNQYKQVTVEHETATCDIFQILKGEVDRLTLSGNGRAIVEGGVVRNITIEATGEMIVLNPFNCKELYVRSLGRLLMTFQSLTQMQDVIILEAGAFITCFGITYRVSESDTMESIVNFFKAKEPLNHDYRL